jgi:putative glutamine amidotransferase
MEITMTGDAPLIGMPAQMDPGNQTQYLSRHYSDAVAAAGGIPVIFPLLEAPQSVRSAAERLDGLLLTGSNSDLDPSLYGEIRSDKCGPAQPLRDRMDFLLLDASVKRKIPILAICFGFQSLNIFWGGSLIQDIPSSVNTPIRHSNPEAKDSAGHKINICSGSILEQIAGGTEVMVNSTHHQAIDRAGKNLEVIARAPDGVIESVCGLDKNHWVLGVQWHPEKSFYCDSFSRKIFEFFLARCRAVRGGDEGYHS